MSDVLQQGMLKILSQLLRVRLAHRAIIDVNIVDREIIWENPKLEVHLGRFLGYFDIRPNGGTCFILFIRTKEDGKFDVAIAFYVNQKLFTIPASERDCFISRFEKFPKMGVVRIMTKLARPCNPSSLLYGIEATIGIHLATQFRKLHVITLDHVVSFEVCDHNASLPSCNVANPSEEVNQLWWDLENHGLSCVDYNCHGSRTLPANFDILRAKFKGHWYYGMYYKHLNVLMVIVCHDALTKSQDDTSQLLNSLARGFGPNKPQNIYAARFKSKYNITCGDKLILDACARFRSFPMLVIKDVDVEALIHYEGLDQLPKFGYDEPELPTNDLVDEPDEPKELIEASQKSATCTVGEDGNVSLASPEIDVVGGLQEHMADVGNRIASQESVVTQRSNDCEPLDDPCGTLLHNEAHFMAYTHRMVRIIRQYNKVSIGLHHAVDFEGLKPITELSLQSYRFLLIPLLSHDVKVLILIDRELKEWGYMNGSHGAPPATFQYVKEALVQYAEYESKLIKMTNYFHRGYPLMHLMAAVTCLSRIFEYAVMIPGWIIYKERDFRNLSHNLCLSMQVACQGHNVQHNLIQRNGVLSAGAFISYPSPIQYEEAAIVKDDQCNFCGKRYSNNTGVHMKMKHGGLAKELRARRQEKDNAA